MYDQHIRFGARARPLSVALSNGNVHVTYRQFDEAIDQIAAALRRAGLGGDDTIVGVSLGDAYQHVLVTLAAMRLGLATSSLFPAMAPAMATLAGVTHLVSDDAALNPAVLADAAWFEAVRTAPVERVPSARTDPDRLARVQLSSGTTGTPKAVGLSWGTLLLRSGLSMSFHGLAARTVSMIGMESGGLGAWAATWRNGGTVLIAPPSPAALAHVLPILQPTMIVASPIQIAALADALDADARPLITPVLISVAGGRVSRAVREKLTLRLGASVAPTYASTEAGTVAAGMNSGLTDERDVGYVMPGINVEIVDDAGTPLPAGETGHLRIAGPGVVDGYREAERSAAFRDGWFHPGDLGSLSADGLLRIAGRADEVINAGGEKVAPETLEELVRPLPGVRDVAAFALPGPAGDQPWLAIVRGEGEVDQAAIVRAVALPGLGPVRIAWIEGIPRTLMGKVRRDELQKAARRL